MAYPEAGKLTSSSCAVGITATRLFGRVRIHLRSPWLGCPENSRSGPKFPRTGHPAVSCRAIRSGHLLARVEDFSGRVPAGPMTLRPAPSLLMKRLRSCGARAERGFDVAARTAAFVAGVVPVDGVAVKPWAIDAVLGGCHRLPADRCSADRCAQARRRIRNCVPRRRPWRRAGNPAVRGMRRTLRSDGCV